MIESSANKLKHINKAHIIEDINRVNRSHIK